MSRVAKMSDRYIYKTQFLSLDQINIICFHHLPLRRPESPAHGRGVIRIFTKPNLVKKNANFFKNDAILTRFFANNTLSLLYQLSNENKILCIISRNKMAAILKSIDLKIVLHL